MKCINLCQIFRQFGDLAKTVVVTVPVSILAPSKRRKRSRKKIHSSQDSTNSKIVPTFFPPFSSQSPNTVTRGEIKEFIRTLSKRQLKNVLLQRSHEADNNYSTWNKNSLKIFLQQIVEKSKFLLQIKNIIFLIKIKFHNTVFRVFSIFLFLFPFYYYFAENLYYTILIYSNLLNIQLIFTFYFLYSKYLINISNYILGMINYQQYYFLY